MNNNVSENPREQHPATPKCVGKAISGTTAKELCAIDSGFAFDSEQFNTDGDGMPIIRIRDIKPGVTNTYTTEAFDSRYLVNDGDMLIGMDGEFNLTKWHSGSALLNQRVCRIQSKSTLLLDDYLRHFLPVALKQIEMRTACVTVKHLSIKALNAIEIPLVSMERQRAIAFQLDNIDEQLGVARKQLSMLDSLVKSRFVEIFGDCHCEKKSIGDLVYEMHIGPFGSAMKSDAFVSEEEAACVVYEQKHAIKQSIDLGWRYVDAAKKSELKRFAAGPGTILVSCRGTIGKVFQLPDNAPIGIIHPSVMKIEIDKSKLNGVFFSFLLEKLFAEAETRAVGSGVKMAIKAKDLASTEIEYPPIQLQQEFADFVAQVDKLRFETQQQIEKLETLKKSLMQEYFG